MMTDRKRPPVVIWIILLMTAFTGVYQVTQRPSFATYRTVDVVQLLGCGVCFGAAMVGLIIGVVRSRQQS
jgi:hypothetical protein